MVPNFQKRLNKEVKRPLQRILNNLCRYSPLKEVEHNAFFPKCRLHMVAFFQCLNTKEGDAAE